MITLTYRKISCRSVPGLPTIIPNSKFQEVPLHGFYLKTPANTALIRPNLEYAGVVLDPYLVKDFVVIENVQKFALAAGLLQAVEL